MSNPNFKEDTLCRNKVKVKAVELFDQLLYILNILLCQSVYLNYSLFVCFQCELYHWVDVLDRFDTILEEGCKTEPDASWHLNCDRPENTKLKQLIHSVLNFTALLIEHSFSRHLYNSIEVCVLSLSANVKF